MGDDSRGEEGKEWKLLPLQLNSCPSAPIKSCGRHSIASRSRIRMASLLKGFSRIETLEVAPCGAPFVFVQVFNQRLTSKSLTILSKTPAFFELAR